TSARPVVIFPSYEPGVGKVRRQTGRNAGPTSDRRGSNAAENPGLPSTRRSDPLWARLAKASGRAPYPSRGEEGRGARIRRKSRSKSGKSSSRREFGPSDRARSGSG